MRNPLPTAHCPLPVLLILALAACSGDADASGRASSGDSTAAVAAADTTPSATQGQDDPSRPPNEMGKIMVVEYHLIGDKNALYERERNAFRQDLQTLYDRGYRPVTMSEVFDKKIDLPAGLSPVVFTFDDASPSQFKYIEKNGQLEIDPNSGIGIWLDFAKKHPDWPNKAVWCLMSGAAAGRSFFGDKGIEGQKTEWRHRKVKYLADQGHELCNHTLWHMQLSKYPDADVQEQIARLQLAVDSAVPGYRIRTMALPQGLWPKNRELAWRGSWTDPKSGKTISYNYDVVLEVAGGPMKSPHDPTYNGHSTPRVQVIGSDVVKTMDLLEKNGTRYVSDGKPGVVARPPARPKPTSTTNN